MPKTDKELAVEITIATINSRQAKIVPMGNGASKTMPGLNIDDINSLIKSVYKTLQDLPEDK